MTWTRDDCPGHAGYLVGLVPQQATWPRPAIADDAWRPLQSQADTTAQYLHALQVGCTCGWRSPRRMAPIDAFWRVSVAEDLETPPSGAVHVSAWFDQEAETIWRAHAIATVFGEQEAQRTSLDAQGHR